MLIQWISRIVVTPPRFVQTSGCPVLLQQLCPEKQELVGKAIPRNSRFFLNLLDHQAVIDTQRAYIFIIFGNNDVR